MSEGSRTGSREVETVEPDDGEGPQVTAFDPEADVHRAKDGIPDQSRASEGRVRVVGTAHVSEASAREVTDVIREEQPDVVAVELDEDRYRQMQGGTPDDLEPADLLRGNTVFQFLAYWMLSYVQTRLGERFDVEPGADMLAAIETATEVGADVALVDRDIQTTVRRFWARLSLLEKFRLLGALAFGVTDPRIAGVTFGVVVGLVLGPVLGLFGSALGVTIPVLTRVTTGVLMALGVGYVGYTAANAFGGRNPLLVGAALGGGIGSVAAVGGVGTSLVSTFVSTIFIQIIGSLTLGLIAGIGIGTVVGLLVEMTGVGLAGEQEEEAFQGFDPDELTDADAVTAMLEEFREFSPGGAAALIDERDAYIAHGLVRLRNAGHHVVAIVGAGHREGVEAYLDRPSDLPAVGTLVGESRRTGVPWGRVVGILLSVGFVAFFVLLAMAGVRQGFLLRLFGAWFVINAVFAAGLARLAGARWASAGVGGAVAWMTSINPLLAPGWFTGYMELRHQAVNVADIATLNELLSDEDRPVRAIAGDMLDVPLFRLIVVVAATNVGSILASLLFATYVLPLFGAEIGGVEGISRLMIEGAQESARVLWGTLT